MFWFDFDERKDIGYVVYNTSSVIFRKYFRDGLCFEMINFTIWIKLKHH